MVAEAELKSQQCWENCSVKIRELVESFEGLQQAMDVYAAITRRPADASNQIGGRMF
jgi:hypothetical protein